MPKTHPLFFSQGIDLSEDMDAVAQWLHKNHLVVNLEIRKTESMFCVQQNVLQRRETHPCVLKLEVM